MHSAGAAICSGQVPAERSGRGPADGKPDADEVGSLNSGNDALARGLDRMNALVGKTKT